MKSKIKLIIYLFIFIFIIFYPFMEKNEYRLYIMNRALIHSILVSGLVFLTGFAGQISLGQAGFYGIGAYTSAILTVTYKLPIPVGILAGTVLSLITGLILSIPSFRLKAFFLSLVTIAFGQIVWLLISNLQSITGGPRGFFGIPIMHFGDFVFDNKAYYFVFLILLVITIIIMYRIKNSYLGRAMVAINNDDIAAETCGINSRKGKTFAFGFSAALAGLAGGLYAHLAGFLSPEPFVFFESSKFVAMAVVGGLRHLSGGVIGGISLTFLPELFRLNYRGWENYYLVMTSVIIVLFVIFLPNGLGTMIFKGLGKLLKEKTNINEKMYKFKKE
jgi:branched-chain amino acid transport system permease protein